MSHDAELGHQPSVSGDIKPRGIDNSIHAITVVVAAVVALCLLVPMLLGNATVFWWLFWLLAMPVAGVMFLQRWYVNTSARRRRAARTAEQNHRFNASQPAMMIGDDVVDAEAVDWRSRDAHEQAVADQEAEAERAEGIESQRQRDASAGNPTDFRARRSDVKGRMIPLAKALEPEPSTDEPEES